MNKLKIMTIVGTRPEIIKLSRVISLLDLEVDHILVHTGQNYDYELNEIFFKDLSIKKPNYFLEAAGSTAAETIGQIIIKIDPILERLSPDAVLLLGDTNSCLASIAIKRHKIPIFHMEAGNRCYDQRVPEENNRKIVDHISDINLTYSNIAREYLLHEGFPADRIIKTGSPMFEVISYYKDQIFSSNILTKLGLNRFNYFLISTHREENIWSDANFSKLIILLNTLAEEYKIPLIVSTHPRTRKTIESKDVRFNPLIRIMKPLGFSDYVNLQIGRKP